LKAAKRKVPSVKLTYLLKNGGWETTFLLGRPILRGLSMLVSGRVEGSFEKNVGS